MLLLPLPLLLLPLLLLLPVLLLLRAAPAAFAIVAGR